MKKAIKVSIALVLLIVGLILIFNKPITNFLVSQMSNSATEQKISQKKSHKGDFNFAQVKSVSADEVAKARLKDAKSDVIGRIAAPSVKMKLAIYYGVNNDSLYRGAGTMKANQKMGEGNYALAGHNMEDRKLLFSPLVDIKVGDHIYLTDDKTVYDYIVSKKDIVESYQVEVIDDIPGQKLLTLITCADEGARRYFIQGKLADQKPITDEIYVKYFK